MVFNDVIAGTEAKKNPIVTKLFLREKKSTFHLFLYHKKTRKHFTFHFKVPKTISVNGTHYFIMTISNKRELQQIASTHSSDTELKNLMKI